MGTPDFALASLEKLVENNYNVVGVVTVADKPAKLDFLDKSEGELVLGPIQKFDQLKRTEYITGNVDKSNIEIKYIGEK